MSVYGSWLPVIFTNVPCVVLVVHRTAGLAEGEWLLSGVRSNRNVQVTPACLGNLV